MLRGDWKLIYGPPVYMGFSQKLHRNHECGWFKEEKSDWRKLVYTNICLHSNWFTLNLKTSKFKLNFGNSICNILGAIYFVFLGDSLIGEDKPYCTPEKLKVAILLAD